MKFVKITLCVVIATLSSVASYGQTYIQAYQDVVNQCSQTNITSNLTEFEALG